MVMSQCYSGAFANAIGGGAGEPSGRYAGSSPPPRSRRPTAATRRSGPRQDGPRFISSRHWAARDHRGGAPGGLATTTPRRTLRTATRTCRACSPQRRARGTEGEVLIDSLLARRGATAAPGRGRSGSWTASAPPSALQPRTLAEVRSRETELDALVKQMSVHTERWKLRWRASAAVGQTFSVRNPMGTPARATHGGRSERGGPRAAADELLPASSSAPDASELWPQLELFRDRALAVRKPVGGGGAKGGPAAHADHSRGCGRPRARRP